MEQTNLKEHRCLCGKLLFKGAFSEGVVEVKCKNCHNISSFFGGNLSESQNGSGEEELSLSE